MYDGIQDLLRSEMTSIYDNRVHPPQKAKSIDRGTPIPYKEAEAFFMNAADRTGQDYKLSPVGRSHDVWYKDGSSLVSP